MSILMIDTFFSQSVLVSDILLQNDEQFIYCYYLWITNISFTFNT